MPARCEHSIPAFRHARERPKPRLRLGPEAIGGEPEPCTDAYGGLPPGTDDVPPVVERALVDAPCDEVHARPVLEVVGLQSVIRHEVAGACSHGHKPSTRVTQVRVRVLGTRLDE